VISEAQHPVYLRLAPEAREFVYIVSDGSDVYTESYTRRNSRTAEEIVAEFINFLRHADLYKEYQSIWRAR
jgi:hypothetical protein